MVTVKKTAQSSRPFHSIRKKLAEAYLAVRVIPLDFHTPSIIEKMNASAFRTVAPYYLFNTIPAVILDILQYGHPALREKCSPIVHINSDILNFLKDMQETLAQENKWTNLNGGLPNRVDGFVLGAVAAGLIIGSALKLVAALKRNVVGVVACALLGGATFFLVAVLRWPLPAAVFGIGALGCALAWRKLGR